MLKNRLLINLTVVFLCVSIAGCATMQRKFVRKKKKQADDAPVVVTSNYDYSKELRVDELYQKHFLFWKSWHGELIDRLDDTAKKRIACFDYTIESLFEIKKYLKEEKAVKLDGFITQLKAREADIKEKRISKSRIYRLTDLLERLKREIDREFAYSKVEGLLELRK